MDNDRPIRRYWGKAKPQMSNGPQWHPLVYHCLDVAACGRELLEADTERRRRLTRLTSLDDEALLAWLSFLLAIHDMGKFSDGFQNLRPDLFQALQGRSTRAIYDERRDTLGWLFAQDNLPRSLPIMMLRSYGTFLSHGCLPSPGITAGPRLTSRETGWHSCSNGSFPFQCIKAGPSLRCGRPPGHGEVDTGPAPHHDFTSDDPCRGR
jgi:hypothetical protein